MIPISVEIGKRSSDGQLPNADSSMNYMRRSSGEKKKIPPDVRAIYPNRPAGPFRNSFRQSRLLVLSPLANVTDSGLDHCILTAIHVGLRHIYANVRIDSALYAPFVGVKQRRRRKANLPPVR